MIVHYGPAKGPEGLGQAVACGQNVAHQWMDTMDLGKVTCRRCLNTKEVRAVVLEASGHVIDLMAALQDSLTKSKRRGAVT